jgi:transcriptional regulator with XRE-family HTH domain
LKVENNKLRAARERAGSLRPAGDNLTRQELAELVNVYVWQRYQQRVVIDDNYVAKLERGTIRWPNAMYREAFRAVLGAPSDWELGFFNPRRVPRPPSHTSTAGLTITGPRTFVPQSRVDQTSRTVPCQLPLPPRSFTARTRELRALTAALTSRGKAAPNTRRVSTISGAGGIGKTALALNWAHQQRNRFPDGQLYADLRGSNPYEPPLSLDAVIRLFLDALGTDSAAIPLDLQSQTQLYRNLVNERQLLVVLDDATDLATVEPLLPESPTCAAIVTSRNRISSVQLRDAHSTHLEPLTREESEQLLAKYVDPSRIAAEPDATADLISHCAGHPLTLGIIATRAACSSKRRLSTIATKSRNRSRLLAGRDKGDLPVHLFAALSDSYEALDADSAYVLLHLALAPGSEIGIPAAAAMVGLPQLQVQQQLYVLENVNLMEQHRPGRYRMHDLTRHYARFRAKTELFNNSSETARKRLVDFYLYTAFSAGRMLKQTPHSIELDSPSTEWPPQEHADRAAAIAWFTTEHDNMVAAQELVSQRGWHTKTWQIAWVLDIYHEHLNLRQSNISTWRTAVAVAEHLDLRNDQARIHCGYGWACIMAGNHKEGINHLHMGLSLFNLTGDLAGQAHAHTKIATAWELQNDYRRSLPQARRALELYEIIYGSPGTAEALNSVGWNYAHLNQANQGGIYCETTLELFRKRRAHHTAWVT